MIERSFKSGYVAPDGYHLAPCDCTCAIECPYGHVGSQSKCWIVKRNEQEWPVPSKKTSGA